MIRAFTDADLDAAAELLAERHTTHRQAEPLLPGDVDFRAQVESEWSVDGASGVISEHGYVFARPLRGWMIVGIGGHAVRGDREHARDLYGAAAGAWLDAGHREHAVFVPSHDAALVDAWFRLSFGASAVLAARETEGEDFVTGVVVRDGTPDDQALAAQLDRAMTESMLPSPSFGTQNGWTDEQYFEEWNDTWGVEHFVHFVAEREGAVVGQLLLYRRPHDLRVPKDSIDLAHASTFPASRGGGVGRALTAHALTWAHRQGIPVMTTDWRMTNMRASRFWPKRGFRPSFLRLHRAIL
ncbi:MAG: GNAT family N-acetyltransferase [Gaiellaceae bacterium]